MKNLSYMAIFTGLTTFSFCDFLVKPYLQPGTSNFENGKEQRTLIFEMESQDEDVKLVLKDKDNKELICILESKPSRFNTLFYRSIFKGLEPNKSYHYQVLQKEKVIFEDEFKLSSDDAPLQLTVFGCAGENTEKQKQIVHLLKTKPMDAIIYLGDFTYSTQVENNNVRAGTATAFRQNFFKPYENLLSKFPICPVIGNKEMDSSNFDTDKDAYAYFDYVSHPLNGPETMPIDLLKGNQEGVDLFLKNLPHYKKGTNYSIDFYKAGKPLLHLQVVDGNAWMDPSQEGLQTWMEQDLKQTKALWKIACIHQPLASCLQRLASYDSLFDGPEVTMAKLFMGEEAVNQKKIASIKNSLIGGMITEKNRVRQYAKVWQENGVQLVFNAHLHGYDRSKPMILLIPTNNDQIIDKFKEEVGKGIVYVVTGAAGAHLHLETLIKEKVPATFKTFITPNYLQNKFSKFDEYTDKINLIDYSFSSLKIDEQRLILEQINEEGKIIDTFEIKKTNLLDSSFTSLNINDKQQI